MIGPFGRLPVRCLAMLLLFMPAAQAQQAAAAPCVDVRIGSEPTFNCVNAQLARAIPPRRFTAGTALPVPTAVPAPAAGSFNQAASAEQYGTAFGHSVQPQRPPPPVYPAPLLPTR